MKQMQFRPLRIRYPVLIVGCALLLFVALLWLCQRQPPLHAQAMSAADLFCRGGSTASSSALCHRQQVTPALLAIYALAFDNDPASPSSLSATYTPTVQSIVSATAAAPDRVAVILADLDGYGDTHVLIVQNGVAVPVEGLPATDALNLPVTLDAALTEYNMADGWYLGNFIRWARRLYPVNQTIFSFVGHGAPLTPQLQPLTEGVPVAAPTPTPTGTPAPDIISPLPPRWGAHSDLTDYHAASLISVRALAQALSIGTEQGTNPLTVVDLLHCFSATIEELYEIHPYARTIIAAPNYTYAQPTMLGETLAAVDPMQPPSVLAQALVASYDAALPAADHPRLFIAVDADKLPPIKAAWDQTTDKLLEAWTNDETATRARLLAAYQASAKYDTTICFPQDWQLAPPDALSDMADFAGRLGAEFGAHSPVGAWALTTTQSISAAILARHAQEGTPWFADVSPSPQWRFPAAGIALFTDFAPTFSDNRPQFSWQAAWYTYTVTPGNLYPYAFIRPTGDGMPTWADLFSRFWTKPITSTAGCIQGFVHGRGTGELTLTDLTVISTGVDAPLFVSVTVQSAAAATNPLLRFRVIEFSDGLEAVYGQVIGAGYLAAGARRTLQSTLPWSPQGSSVYTITATIDLDNRFTEENEADNTLTRTLSLQVINRLYLPVVAR